MWIWQFAVYKMLHNSHNGFVLKNGRLYKKNRRTMEEPQNR